MLTDPISCKPPLKFRELEADRASIEFLSKLGSGCFGDVFKARYNGIVEVALKTLKPGSMSREKFLQVYLIFSEVSHSFTEHITIVDSSLKIFQIWMQRLSVISALKEARTMHLLSHPHIVQILGVCTREEPILILTELMANGSLLEYLRKTGPVNLKYSDIIDMIAQVTMCYLLNYANLSFSDSLQQGQT